MRTKLRMAAVAACAVASACLSPEIAPAQSPIARVVLYEVAESLQLRAPRRGPEQLLARLADASLLGTQVEAFTPGTPWAAAQYMIARATSSISLNPGTFGIGPIEGDFTLAVLQDLDGKLQLSDLIQVATGELRGTLDLRPALDPLAPKPYASVSGDWRIGPHWNGKRFAGAFLIPFELPFELPSLPQLTGKQMYLHPADLGDGHCRSNEIVDLTAVGLGPVCLLLPEESVLGFPLTKAVIYLYD